MSEYLYRVVDKNGVPYASGNTVKSVKTYKESTARRIAKEQTAHHNWMETRRGDFDSLAPFRVQRAAVQWEDLND